MPTIVRFHPRFGRWGAHSQMPTCTGNAALAVQISVPAKTTRLKQQAAIGIPGQSWKFQTGGAKIVKPRPAKRAKSTMDVAALRARARGRAGRVAVADWLVTTGSTADLASKAPRPCGQVEFV